MATLLLTSTIEPPAGVLGLVVTDPARRLEEYRRALRFYAERTGRAFTGIVYVDNSERADLAPIRELGAGLRLDVEVLAAPPTPVDLGRGEGEAQIVDHAMHASRLLAAERGHVWKVTGRYVVRNLEQVAIRAPRTALHMHLRNRPALWADTYAYAFTRAGYDRMLAPSPRERLGVAAHPRVPMEVAWGRGLARLLAEGEDVGPRFGVEPVLSGVRGVDGRSYDGPRQRAKRLTRTAVRRLAPDVWI